MTTYQPWRQYPPKISKYTRGDGRFFMLTHTTNTPHHPTLTPSTTEPSPPWSSPASHSLTHASHSRRPLHASHLYPLPILSHGAVAAQTVIPAPHAFVAEHLALRAHEAKRGATTVLAARAGGFADVVATSDDTTRYHGEDASGDGTHLPGAECVH